MTVILDNLTVSYQRHPAVHHVSGSFVAGDATAIFGPNGAGKSTLLKAMIGALTPDSGQARLEGFARQDIAYLPQQSEIDRSLPVSVLDLVASGLWHRTGPFGKVGRAGLGPISRHVPSLRCPAGNSSACCSRASCCRMPG